MKLDDGRSREDGDGPQVGSAIMKLPKGLSIIDKPYLVKEDIMKCYNKGDDRNYLVDYAAWVNSLKLPLTGRRLLIV